jgi:hypothetical protein
MFTVVCFVLQGEAVRKVQVPNTVRLQTAKQQHTDTRSEMEAQARRAAKLDKKANILITGLQQRDKKLQKQLTDVANQVWGGRLVWLWGGLLLI